MRLSAFEANKPLSITDIALPEAEPRKFSLKDLIPEKIMNDIAQRAQMHWEGSTPVYGFVEAEGSKWIGEATGYTSKVELPPPEFALQVFSGVLMHDNARETSGYKDFSNTIGLLSMLAECYGSSIFSAMDTQLSYLISTTVAGQALGYINERAVDGSYTPETMRLAAQLAIALPEYATPQEVLPDMFTNLIIEEIGTYSQYEQMELFAYLKILRPELELLNPTNLFNFKELIRFHLSRNEIPGVSRYGSYVAILLASNIEITDNGLALHYERAQQTSKQELPPGRRAF